MGLLVGADADDLLGMDATAPELGARRRNGVFAPFPAAQATAIFLSLARLPSSGEDGHEVARHGHPRRRICGGRERQSLSPTQSRLRGFPFNLIVASEWQSLLSLLLLACR